MEKTQFPLYKAGFNPLEYADYEQTPGFIKFLNERQFYLRDLGIPSRIFNQWRKYGLIDEYKSGQRKWVMLSFGQHLWLRIIQDLRKFALPLEDIKRIKESFTLDIYSDIEKNISRKEIDEVLLKITDSMTHLTSEQKEDVKKEIAETNLLKRVLDIITPKPASFFEMAIIHMVVVGKPVYLTLFLTDKIDHNAFEKVAPSPAASPGKRKKKRRQTFVDFFLHTGEFENMAIKKEELQRIYEVPHMKLPLRTYIKEFISDLKNEKRLEDSMIITKEELLLLKELRKDNVREITIKMNQQDETSEPRINRIEVTSVMKKDLEARLIETFTSNEYADINYKVADGKIVFFEKTTKKKLK